MFKKLTDEQKKELKRLVKLYRRRKGAADRTLEEIFEIYKGVNDGRTEQV